MRRLLELVRWDEWYDSKIALFLLAYYYLLLAGGKAQLRDMLLLFPLAFFFISLASFGFMLNDYSDRLVDKASGKESVMGSLTTRQQMIALAMALFSGLLAFIPFYGHKYAVAFLSLSYLSSILYSAYPFRLKTRGVWGIVCVSLAQWVLPTLIVFSIFEHFATDTFLFATLSWFIGLRWILVHQLADRDRDMRAKIETYATARDPARTFGRMKLIFVVETICLLAFVAVIIHTLCYRVVPLIVAYSLFLLYQTLIWRRLGAKRVLASYDFAPFADLYFLWLPFGLSILLGCMNPWFFIIAAIELLWKRDHIKLDLRYIRLRGQYV